MSRRASAGSLTRVKWREQALHQRRGQICHAASTTLDTSLRKINPHRDRCSNNGSPQPTMGRRNLWSAR